MPVPNPIENPSVAAAAAAPVSIDKTFYVSVYQGSNVTGDGSISKPYATIAFAISMIPAHGNSYSVWANERWTIHLEPGRYTEAGPIIFKQIRRSMRLYGDGATVEAEVRFENSKLDYPDGVLFSAALVPVPWGPPTTTIPLCCWELAGESGGMEGGHPAINLILLGRVLYKVTSLGLGAIGPMFWLLKNVQSFGGMEYEGIVGGGLGMTVEVNDSSIINENIGWDGIGAGGSFSLKAHNSQLRGTLGPFLTVLEIDSCRISGINRTLDFSGGAVAGIVIGSTATGQVHITDCCFDGATYLIGAAVPGASVLNIDDVSLRRLNAQGFTLTNCVFRISDRGLRLFLALVASTVLTVDGKVILVDALAAARTITLPTAASMRFDTITIKKTDLSANAVIVDASGAETIDGALTISITSPNESVDLFSDGTSWWIV